jgi:CRISPR-associated protein Csx10
MEQYAGCENIGGFNCEWGLPLLQVPALMMGSVFIFQDFQLTEEQIKLQTDSFRKSL